jgi:hypothetical protein
MVYDAIPIDGVTMGNGVNSAACKAKISQFVNYFYFGGFMENNTSSTVL